MPSASLRLDDHLTTTATGPYRLLQEFPIRSSGGNGQYLDAYIRVLCPSREKGCALCTETRGIGGILLITANDLHPIVQTDGCSHMESRVGGITPLRGFDG